MYIPEEDKRGTSIPPISLKEDIHTRHNGCPWCANGKKAFRVQVLRKVKILKFKLYGC